MLALSSFTTRFSYNAFSHLKGADDDDSTWDYKFPDAIGNLFRTQKQTDRTYGKAGQLLKDENFTYTYDPLGNLIKKESATETWEYVWNAQGRLSAVLTPKKGWVQYTYDALGRRVTKTHRGETTHYIWDGNVLFHEWTAKQDESHTQLNEAGKFIADLNVPMKDAFLLGKFDLEMV